MKKLIVNADDYGLTYGVCKGIIKACNDGIVRSTTVMINMPEIENKIELLNYCNNLKTGVHLNVTCGEPVSDPKDVPTLLNETGSFWRKPDIVIEKADISQVEKEWTAQIEKALKLGLKISHIDTHHHSHTKPQLTDIYMKLAKKYNIAARSNNPVMAEHFRQNGIKTTDYFIEEFYGDKVSKENFIKIINNLSDGSTEVCSHPAFIDDELVKISSYREYRLNELETYIDKDILNLITQNNIEITSFNGI